jgi:hypothetical protein
MSDPKYVVITAGNCSAANRAAALKNMNDFSKDLHNGTDVLATRHGVTLSGLNPGALVFIQMYHSLAGLESAMDVISTSSAYASLINDQKVQPYVRNIAKVSDVPFDNSAAVDVKYLVFTRAERISLSAQEMTEKMVAAAPLFAANGAQSLRFGHFITGDSIGQHLLGVSYKSMAAIEQTYDALAQDDNFRQMSTEIDINMRSIIQLYG